MIRSHHRRGGCKRWVAARRLRHVPSSKLNLFQYDQRIKHLRFWIEFKQNPPCKA